MSNSNVVVREEHVPLLAYKRIPKTTNHHLTHVTLSPKQILVGIAIRLFLA